MPRSGSGFVAVVLILLSSTAGCRQSPLSPLGHLATVTQGDAPLATETTSDGFYPLTLGNHWHYQRSYVTRWQDASGAPQEYRLTDAIERELLCETVLDGRTYMAERTLEFDPAQTSTSWVYFRQDRGGLYEADTPAPPPCGTSASGNAVASRVGRLGAIAESGRPPTDAAIRTVVLALEQRLAITRYTLGLAAPSLRRPHPAPGELLRLAYPLHPGRAWVVRDDPRFRARDLGVEVLRLPAGRFVAHRIRIDSVLFGPHDRVTVWYGRKGFLKLDAHLVAEGVDESGNPIGLVESEDREVLDGLTLVGDAAGD